MILFFCFLSLSLAVYPRSPPDPNNIQLWHHIFLFLSSSQNINAVGLTKSDFVKGKVIKFFILMAEVIKEAPLFVAIDTIKADGRKIKTSLKRARFAPKKAEYQNIARSD